MIGEHDKTGEYEPVRRCSPMDPALRCATLLEDAFHYAQKLDQSLAAEIFELMNKPRRFIGETM